MEEKDWKRLEFRPRPDTWFLPNYQVEHKGDHTTWKDDLLIEEGCGGFGGWTLEGSSDGNPVHDGYETCGYDEFDIFLRDEKVNEWTYAQLKERMVLHRCVPSMGKYAGMNGKGSYGPAFVECLELPNGELWITNDEYDSRVNFCPVCGMKAKVGTEASKQENVEKVEEKEEKEDLK